MADERAHLVKVGDVWLPGIVNFSTSMEDIDTDATTRDEEGYMHREILRPKVKKISFSCKLKTAQLVETVQLVYKDATFEMTAWFPEDPNADENGFITSEFYVSNMKKDLFDYNNGYWVLTYNAVEV